MRRIYLVTHPEARHHVDGLVGGWFDSELTDRGRADAEQVARRLGEVVPRESSISLYSSDLRRATHTAAAVASHLNASVISLPALRERSYGAAEGRRAPSGEILTGAEPEEDWIARVGSAVDTISAAGTDIQVVVTHGGTKNLIIASWLGVTPQRWPGVGFHVHRGASPPRRGCSRHSLAQQSRRRKSLGLRLGHRASAPPSGRMLACP